MSEVELECVSQFAINFGGCVVSLIVLAGTFGCIAKNMTPMRDERGPPQEKPIVPNPVKRTRTKKTTTPKRKAVAKKRTIRKPK